MNTHLMKTIEDIRICVIGGGAMGGAIIAGLLDVKDINPKKLSVSNPHMEKISLFETKGVNIFTDNIKAIKDADLIVLAVKPWIIPNVIKEISSYIDLEKTEVCSLAAGITNDELKGFFGSYMPKKLTVAIPNTAMAVKESMTFIVPVSGNAEMSVKLFEFLGKVMIIEERQLPGAMALASCGIAFVMRYIRASVEGGVELGIRPSDGLKMVTQTLAGAVAILEKGESHPEAEIDKVTTPGGITIKGLNTMERYGFSSSIIEGLKACKA